MSALARDPAGASLQAAATSMAQAQFDAALWADAALAPYAVVLAERVPDLLERLAASAIDDYDCLWAGALAPQQAAAAPYLIRLRRNCEFSDWLCSRASEEFADWGVLLLSARALLGLRNALRELARARLPEGQTIDLAWMDPPVLRALLPLLDPGQIEPFSRCFEAVLVPGAGSWSWWRLRGATASAQMLRIVG